MEIRVIDDGIGMTKDVTEKCFDPEFSTKGNKGNGLGLANVKNLLQKMGGDIRVEDSQLDGGTTFIISLPIAEQASQAAVA